MIVHFSQYGSPLACLKPFHEEHWSPMVEDVTCEECRKGMLEQGLVTYVLHEEDPKKISIECLRCHKTSHHPEDVRQHYCANCHTYHDDLWPPARKAWLASPPLKKRSDK